MTAVIAPPTVRVSRTEVECPFNGDQEILDRQEMARKIAREFRRERKYPIEAVELEAEAILALTQAAREFPGADTRLPFGPYAAQRILWRLEDFIQAWYRLGRRDFNTGRTEVRRIVGLSAVDGPDGQLSGGQARSADTDPNANLYIEDCHRLVDRVLNLREKQVIALKYEEHKTLKQIAKELGITHIRARQIHSESIAALRAAMGSAEGNDDGDDSELADDGDCS